MASNLKLNLILKSRSEDDQCPPTVVLIHTRSMSMKRGFSHKFVQVSVVYAMVGRRHRCSSFESCFSPNSPAASLTLPGQVDILAQPYGLSGVRLTAINTRNHTSTLLQARNQVSRLPLRLRR